jgi:uncharacterized protein (TIGR02466 family)
MASTAATLGYDDEVAALVDQARWFSTTQLAVPADFNRQLAAELLAHKSRSPLHSTKTTRGTGTWIKRLDPDGGPLAQELLAQIRAAVETYIADRRAFADHPVMKHRPKWVDMDSWATEVRQDGYQKLHIHPNGWISGVYYVAVPNIERNENEYPGAIDFRLFPFGQKRENARLPQWRVMPKAGVLLIFPSYFAHATRPTGVGDVRISVAFDVRAKTAPGASS